VKQVMTVCSSKGALKREKKRSKPPPAKHTHKGRYVNSGSYVRRKIKQSIGETKKRGKEKKDTNGREETREQ